MARIGRNACPCGSGKEIKKCCMDKPAHALPKTGKHPRDVLVLPRCRCHEYGTLMTAVTTKNA